MESQEIQKKNLEFAIDAAEASNSRMEACREELRISNEISGISREYEAIKKKADEYNELFISELIKLQDKENDLQKAQMELYACPSKI